MNDAVGSPAAPTPRDAETGPSRVSARTASGGSGESRWQRVPDPAPLRVGLGRRRHDDWRRRGRTARDGRELGSLRTRAARGRSAGRRRRVGRGTATEQDQDDQRQGEPHRGAVQSGHGPHPSAGHDRTPSRPSATGSCGLRTRSPGPSARSASTIAVVAARSSRAPRRETLEIQRMPAAWAASTAGRSTRISTMASMTMPAARAVTVKAVVS